MKWSNFKSKLLTVFFNTIMAIKNIASDLILKRSRQLLAYYNFKRLRSFTILNSEETLNYIIAKQPSVSRFGDGEFQMILGGGSGFQDASESLAKRLDEVLNSSGTQSGHIVCIPYPFVSCRGRTKRSHDFWKDYLTENYKSLLQIVPPHKTFYDACFTRFYIAYLNENYAQLIFDKIKRIWDNREIVIVEGAGTRIGVNNDLFSNAISVGRIICPSKNAWDVYDQILDYICNNINKNILILCTLGMTATVLAYDLSQCGYQAIDIGHVDIEYEWFRMKVQERCPIVGKSVNECGINDPDEIMSSDYHSQIIQTIEKKDECG